MGTNTTVSDLFLQALTTLQDPQPVWNKPAFIISITATSLATATICILFRLYRRVFVVRSPGWDDVFVTMYLMTGIMAGVSLCISPKFGNGEHLLRLIVEPNRLLRFLKTFYVTNASITMSMTIIKLSILLQYLRLFSPQEHPRTRRVTIITLVIIAIVGSAFTILGWVPCWPISNFWDFDYFTADNKHCWGFASTNHQQLYYTFLSWNILNLVGDLVILSLPLGMLRNPETEKRTKRGICGLISMGLLANGLCIWRLVETINNRAGTYPVFDPSWNAPIIMVLAILEINLGSICASVPVFWPGLTEQIGRVFVTREVFVTRSVRESVLLQREQDHHHQQHEQQQQQSPSGDGVIWDTSDGSDSDIPLKSPNPFRFTQTRSQSVSTVQPAGAPPWGFRTIRANSDASTAQMVRGRDDSVSSCLSTMLAELEKGGDAQQTQHNVDRSATGHVDPLGMPGGGFSVEAVAVSLSSVSRKGSKSSSKFSVNG